MPDELRTHYRRNLPHHLPPGHTVFVTYRLAGTLPWHIRQLLEEEQWSQLPAENRLQDECVVRRKRAFVRYDTWLDTDTSQVHWLTMPDIAAVVRESIFHFDQQRYVLHAFCIMPNHVHILLTIDQELDKPFYQILQSQKRYSATRANRLLNRTGAFWQAESYDHVVRNEREFGLVLNYVLQNPVKAGLVTDWSLWAGTYLAES